MKIDRFKEKLVLTEEETTDDPIPEEPPAQRQRLISRSLVKCYAMSSSNKLSHIANLSRNSNNCPNNIDSLTHADIILACVNKIQTCVSNRDVKRAAKKINQTIREKSYRTSLIKHLSKYIMHNECNIPLLG